MLCAEQLGSPALTMAHEGWAGRMEMVWPCGCGRVLGHAVLASALQQSFVLGRSFPISALSVLCNAQPLGALGDRGPLKPAELQSGQQHP